MQMVGWNRTFKPGTRWETTAGGIVEICSESWISRRLNIVAVVSINGRTPRISSFDALNLKALCIA